MRLCALAVCTALLFLLAVPCRGQTAGAQKVSPECKNRSLKKKLLGSPQFKFLPGESYKAAPTVKFQINEDGSVSNVTLTRSSGVKGIDKWVIKEVSGWKYTPVLGCIIETNMTLVIDWE